MTTPRTTETPAPATVATTISTTIPAPLAEGIQTVAAQLPAVQMLDTLANEVREAHISVLNAAADMLTHAKTAGEKLIAAQKEHKRVRQHDRSLPPWTEWLSQKCTVSVRTAQDYMRLAKEWKELSEDQKPMVARMSIRAAIRYFRGPSATTAVKKLKLRIERTELEQKIESRVARKKLTVDLFIQLLTDLGIEVKLQEAEAGEE